MFNLEYLVTSLIVVLIPGTGVIYTLTTSISGNKRSAIIAALGCTLGIVPHLLAAVLGISAIVNASAQIFSIIKFVGVLYLVYLGVDLLRSKSSIQLDKYRLEPAYKIILKAILINVLNPKLTIFFLSFLPQFINQQESGATHQMLGLSLMFMIITFAVFCIYGLLAQIFKKVLTGSPNILRGIQKGFGAAIIVFAGKLALDE